MTSSQQCVVFVAAAHIVCRSLQELIVKMKGLLREGMAPGEGRGVPLTPLTPPPHPTARLSQLLPVTPSSPFKSRVKPRRAAGIGRSRCIEADRTGGRLSGPGDTQGQGDAGHLRQDYWDHDRDSLRLPPGARDLPSRCL